jgi:hypothetical protein
MKPEARVEGCLEDTPRVAMSEDALYSIPRFWEKAILGRRLSNAAISRYEQLGSYRERRGVWQQSGNRLVYSG